MIVTVARIGRAHGLKGEVSVELRTDIPEERLVPGASFSTEPSAVGPLTVTRTRQQSGRWYVQFEQLRDRDAAEAARGVSLLIDADEDEEDDAWFVHELVGLTAERPDGTLVGKVVDLQPMPAQDLLVVAQASGHRALIPFVADFVLEVDVDTGRVVVDPPYGLLDGEQPESTGETAGEA
ncbi:ribosome maturation factor RimM [Demequina capsici]|uniref:Ribosome maturation factor RimM n=1 Tax=Demequina capsici TaxID=3075620 RepID=A0AA96FBE3_9MICO|nr:MULTISPECIES: ribosome maturation factor RimM [unclassified Demequina]WNM23435.1 ribosome maturation factor RimM [Demequina sp. OYTSA14]WNM26312.1 ribosome maturation factor RimM [Demequina sp. PMTSA13]